VPGPAGPLAGRRIVLGVSGGISAYKAVEVCRLLVGAGAEVSPVLTTDATRFVGALTFSALAGHPARVSLWDGPDPIPHTRLGQWAELIVVAPATARVLGAYAAMHTEMWEHPAVQDNIARLRARGVGVVGPGVGRLAGGDEGAGRLADPPEIVAAAAALLAHCGVGADLAGRTQDLAGYRVLVTAGGTREPIDPVRFIGNRSSGKQGHAVAIEAAARGASVTLVTTASLPVPLAITVVTVDTAAEMADEVEARAAGSEVVIMAAAVADFRPKVVADQKMKKVDGPPELVLEPTPDILAGLGARRHPGQLLVGFAAETGSEGDLRSLALDKLRRKHIDLMVANDVSAPNVGFGHDTNAVLIVAADGSSIEVPMAEKGAIAGAVIDAVVARLPLDPS
jgi:phosphopantothenoylcysteine decarboxylase/phosphopantothenate--cysteine ligase